MRVSTFVWMCVWTIVVVFLAVKFSEFFVVYNRQFQKRTRVRTQDLEYVKLNCRDNTKMVTTGGTPDCDLRRDRLTEGPVAYALHDYMKTRGWCGEDGCDGRLHSMTNPFEILVIVVIVISVVMFILFLCIARGNQTPNIPLSMLAPSTRYPQYQVEPSRWSKLADTIADLIHKKVASEDILSGDPIFKKKKTV